ncbi:MAG: hypothetical protein IAB75_11105 [Bacteroidetes bacterium]|uniref:Uncharacterized protein n=1 Tax=Candidatus Cryptobacteroides avicola TaxID=2840757 RepID=A0A940E196_9BACT|nr:hypothetical protein [Candidatus Cryptobacteroides avicola]
MKNNIFSFSRFGRYCGSSLASICSGKGLSILAFGLIPVYVFVLDILFSSFGHDYQYMFASSRSAFFAITGAIFVIWMPAACYGHITEKRAGSMFTLLPASSLEKALSMIINTMIIIPLSFLAIYFALDLLITLAVGSPVKDSIVVYLFTEPLIPVKLSFTDMLLSAVNNMLVFLLGAVIFKRHKIAKTILVLMGISIVVSFGVASVINAIGIDWVTSADFDMDRLFLWNTVWSCILCAALSAGIFFRIRKIQY